jgi:pimeloyl-ACP methyl ester carboxylesterase
VDRLAGTHVCKVFTIAGFAGVPAGATPDFDSVQQKIAEYARLAGGDKPVLVGHSFGGILAMAVAASHPELFSRVVIVDAVPFPSGLLSPAMSSQQAKEQASAVRNALLQLDTASVKQFLKSGLSTAVQDTAMLAQIVRWMAASDRQTLAQAEYVALSCDLRRAIANITIPALVLGTWAGREPFGLNAATLNERLHDQFAMMPDCAIAISNSSRHFIMYDDPQWLVDQLTEFLKK